MKEHRLSSRKRRIGAFLIDHFVISIFIVSIAFLSLGPDFIDETNFRNVGMKLVPAMCFGILLYLVKDAIKGISLGKWILGIMVRDQNETDKIPSFGRLFVRNLCVFIWPVEFIVLAINNDKKRLGDKIAKTVVIINPTKPSRLIQALVLGVAGITFFLFTFFFIGSVIKNSEAYKEAVENIEINQEIISETGGIKGYGILPTGNVHISNGYGQAHLEIKVLGVKNNLNVKVYLTKELNEEWKLVKISK